MKRKSFSTQTPNIMALEINSTVIKIIGFGILLLTALIVFLTRSYFRQRACENLTEKNRNRRWRSPLEGRNKYPEVDTFQWRSYFLEYGVAVALLLMILAFGWTTHEEKSDLSLLFGSTSDEIEMETPRTAELPPPPPPPPPPAVLNFVVTEAPVETAMTFADMSIDAETEVVAPLQVAKQEKTAAVAPPPPPPPMPEEEREIFKIVETSPMFPGCEEIADKAERQACAERRMMEFIYQNIQYPAIARENGVGGKVYVQFVVERDGSISNINVVRDIGGGCGEEAKRVVGIMPTWNPGRQRERPVRVQFTLPVHFKLT